MNACRKRQLTPLFVGIVMASAGEAAAGALPKDPCALLKAAEVQTLAAGAQVGGGKLDASAVPIATGCTYTWGPRTDKWGHTSMMIMVTDLSKAYPGTSPDLIRQGLLRKAQAAGPNASQIAGVGDAAVFSYEARPYNAMAEALVLAKGHHVLITFHHGDSAASKDKLATLLKLAVGRL